MKKSNSKFNRSVLFKDEFDHACIFYHSFKKLSLQLNKIISTATETKTKFIFVRDEHSPDFILNKSLTKLNQKRSFFNLESTSLIGLNISPFSIETFTNKVEALIETIQTKKKFETLVLFVEMSWIHRSPSGAANIGLYEATTNEILKKHSKVKFICLYNRKILIDTQLLTGLHSHPYLIGNAGVLSNPHYLPSNIHLCGSIEERLNCWLRNIDHSLVSDDAGKPISNSSLHEIMENETAQPRSHFLLNNALTIDGKAFWKIRCFGPLRIYRQDGSKINWGSKGAATLKVKTLFAYLLFCGARGASIEELSDLLWAEATSFNQGRNRLYQTVRYLRQALSPELKPHQKSDYIIRDSGRYILVLPTNSWIDIPVFEQLCYRSEQMRLKGDHEQSLICLQSAEKLYTNSLLSDIPTEYSDNPENDWCWSQKYWLQEMYQKLLWNCAKLLRQKGEMNAAIDFCRKAIDVDPLCINAHQELFLIFHAQKRKDALKRQYNLYLQTVDKLDEGAPDQSLKNLFLNLEKSF